MAVLPPRAAIKLAIHKAMCKQGMTQAQEGERLGIDRRQVRRILDLDHESKLSQLETALAALGVAGICQRDEGFAGRHKYGCLRTRLENRAGWLFAAISGRLSFALRRQLQSG
jgi:predicted XRE-type DNA-binding protein